MSPLAAFFRPDLWIGVEWGRFIERSETSDRWRFRSLYGKMQHRLRRWSQLSPPIFELVLVCGGGEGVDQLDWLAESVSLYHSGSVLISRHLYLFFRSWMIYHHLSKVIKKSHSILIFHHTLTLTLFHSHSHFLSLFFFL